MTIRRGTTGYSKRARCFCAWCGRERKGEGVWERSGMSVEQKPVPVVTHGICPDCARKLLGAGTWHKTLKRVD